MADIGASLREARMRAKIDISEVEAHTKIRAKYLRALENEEWGLLPGPTFVKTFLRTYAEFLQLDARLLLDEYKARFERLSEADLPPITPLAERRRMQQRAPRGPSSRTMALAVAFLGLAAALFALSRIGGDDDDGVASRPPPLTTEAATDDGSRDRERAERRRERQQAEARARRRRVRLQIVPTGPVYVCLQAAGGRTLIPGEILGVGARTRTYRSRSFRMTLGNGNVELRVNGRARTVPDTSDGVGYLIDSRGRRTPLSGDARPDCAG